MSHSMVPIWHENSNFFFLNSNRCTISDGSTWKQHKCCNNNVKCFPAFLHYWSGLSHRLLFLTSQPLKSKRQLAPFLFPAPPIPWYHHIYLKTSTQHLNQHYCCASTNFSPSCFVNILVFLKEVGWVQHSCCKSSFDASHLLIMSAATLFL